jgi:hypothetical protein
MPINRDPTPEELGAAAESRALARKADAMEKYLVLLRLAQRIRADHGGDTDLLAELVKHGDDELHTLHQVLGGRILPRGRPKLKPQTETGSTCTVYLDECGSHSVSAKDPFGAFVLAGVIIPDAEYDEIDRRWKQWKRTNLGAAEKIVHEPDVRKGRGPFWCDGHPLKRAPLYESLGRILDELPFSAVACVIHREDYLTEFPEPQLNALLPAHHYLMNLHFLTERVLYALEEHFGGQRAHFVAESRGPREDAALQYEFARLHLDGTAYISDAWVRQQLTPDISFQAKRDNNTGLQLADLLARPCGEKVLDPSSAPDRWAEFRGKLCQGRRTKNSILGLKCLPWKDEYAEIWTR